MSSAGQHGDGTKHQMKGQNLGVAACHLNTFDAETFPSISDDEFAASLMDPPGVLSLETIVCLAALDGYNTKEKLSADAITVAYLKQIQDMGKLNPSDVLQKIDFDQFKLEEPMLPFDHDLEMRKLRRQVADNVELQDILPLLPDMEVKDDAEDFADAVFIHEKVMAELSNEKLTIDRPTALFLQDVMTPPDIESMILKEPTTSYDDIIMPPPPHVFLRPCPDECNKLATVCSMSSDDQGIPAVSSMDSSFKKTAADDVAGEQTSASPIIQLNTSTRPNDHHPSNTQQESSENTYRTTDCLSVSGSDHTDNARIRLRDGLGLGQSCINETHSDVELPTSTKTMDDASAMGMTVAAVPSLPSPDVGAHHKADTTRRQMALHHQARPDFMTLLRKRKRELDAECESWLGLSDHKDDDHPEGRTDQALNARSGALHDSGSRNHDGLARFLQVYAAHKSPLESMPFSNSPSRPPRKPSAPTPVLESEIIAVHAHETSPVAVPNIIASPMRSFIVVTPVMASNRAFLRDMQASLPNVTMIERTAETLQHDTPSKLQRLFDADITTSPSAGVVLTTVQRLHQRALPGQTVFCSARDRIAATSLRYEHLTILVSEGKVLTDVGLETSAGNQRDAQMLADFTAFVRTLEANIEVSFVPGTQADLAKWTTAYISRQQLEHNEDVTLWAEETSCERWLRQAGLNAYAAQIILGDLMKPHQVCDVAYETSEHEQSVPASALSAFVKLSARQRIDRFASIMSGDRVLARVNQFIGERHDRMLRVG